MEMLSKSFSISKSSIKFVLNLIENCHNNFFRTLNSQNIIPKEYISRIPTFEEQLKSYSPFTLIFFGLFMIFLYYFLKLLYSCLIKCIHFFLNIKENFIILYLKLPGKRKFLEETKAQINNEFKKMFKKKFKKIDFFDNKQDYTKILSKMEENLKGDKTKIECGKLTGSVYCQNDQIKYIAGEASKMFLYSNLLHPDIYTYTRYIEAELIKLGVQLFNGKEDACGVTTSGGTMSIVNAIYAYVKRGKKLGITKPEIIISITAHCAFEKACEMFDVKCIKIPLEKNTYQINLKLVEKNISQNTICIVGSFPNFPHCIADNIEQLSKLGVKYKIPIHVDCCLGGFLVAFHERAGITDTPLFDFRLPGVTSISADLHKYGLCPKGISLLLFSKHEYRKNLFFYYPRWPGSTYMTPGFEGSRTGALIASSFAVLNSMGKEFYSNNAKEIFDAVKKLKEFINKECDLIKVIGNPFICGVSFTGKYIAHFYDKITERGFAVNYVNSPEGVGFIFTSANVKNAENYMKALKEINDELKVEQPKNISDVAKLYGFSYKLPQGIASDALESYPDFLLD
jgi:sphinganine-1-phosphate aldolase